MESPKYLIIVTLIDGQNFALPDGTPDKVEASVFAEARFGDESYLKSDPIKLVSSNPEFVTELAWQLDKKSLHQLRVERRSIKLQIFMQTKEKKKNIRQRQQQPESSDLINGLQPASESNNEAHKVELIGYTIIDIRSAQETDKPRFTWLPLLNPKFRKPSYNRPEVQLALTLHRLEEETGETNSLPSNSFLANDEQSDTSYNEELNGKMESLESGTSANVSIDDTRLYKTCLDITLPESVKSDEIIENDLIIKSKDGVFYIFDAKNAHCNTMDSCKERYRITITIPFNSDLNAVVKDLVRKGGYYFSVSLLGSLKRTRVSDDFGSSDVKAVDFEVRTTHLSVLSTYFELNSNMTIKLHYYSGESIGVATIQVDQLCSLDTKRRSIEGIFALQSLSEHDIPSAIHSTIGVSVMLEHIEEEDGETKPKCEPERENKHPERDLISERHIEMAEKHFGADINDLFNSMNETHQITFESNYLADISSADLDQEDHHYCFTIDLKKFSYSPSQRLIPTLRELVVRYSYPFFGYQDTITTDASIPINANNSIIVSGFCEFNFATTVGPLLTALKEIPLNLDILTCDETHLEELTGILDPEEQRLVATCNINLADIMCLNEFTINQLKEKAISTTASVPIYGLDGTEIGNLQMYLCLLDRGRPSYDFKASVDNLDDVCQADKHQISKENKTLIADDTHCQSNSHKLELFIGEAKSSFESWKEDFEKKIYDDIHRRENERFKRLYQRLEAKDARRESEFKKKIDDLCQLENRFRKSLACVETLERTLASNFEQMKTKDALLDSRLDTLDIKISQAINNVRLEYDKKFNSIPALRQQRSLDENQLGLRSNVGRVTPTVSRTAPEINGTCRTSIRGTTSANNQVGSIPLPIRSSSLVRNSLTSTTEGNTTRFVKRPVGMVTIVNGVGKTRNRLSLSKETQEKLASLRREKAELIKRGCKPNDELIQEINSLIEKLVC